MARLLTILCAEDDADDFVFMRRAFEKTGAHYNLVRVPNGEEAVGYLHGDGPYHDRAQYPFPDLLLLDLKMPMMDGFDVLAWWRQQPRAKDLPVVVLTGSNQDRDVQLARAMGAADYQVKPLETDALAALVARLETRWLHPPRDSRS
jgi:CheY-like chemotaxis protein